MRSNMEINEDFYTLEPDEQDRNLMCETCIHNDGESESCDSDDWHDEQSEDDYDEY